MYYTQEFVERLDARIDDSVKGEKYLENTAKAAVLMLENNKLNYKLFGVYWWAVKEAIRKYARNDKWYCKDFEDTLMKEKAWHGSLYLTVLAGSYYMNQCNMRTSTHSYYDKNENEIEYTLFDSDAEC